jgi:hypothetical protein
MKKRKETTEDLVSTKEKKNEECDLSHHHDSIVRSIAGLYTIIGFSHE